MPNRISWDRRSVSLISQKEQLGAAEQRSCIETRFRIEPGEQSLELGVEAGVGSLQLGTVRRHCRQLRGEQSCARLAEPRLDDERVPEALHRGLSVPELAQQLALVAQGLGEFRSQRQGALARLERLLASTTFAQRPCSVQMRLGQIGPPAQRPVRVFQCLRAAPQSEQRARGIGQHVGALRGGYERRVVVPQRLLQVPESALALCPQQPCLEQLRSKPERLFDALQRIGRLVQCEPDAGGIAMRLGQLRIVHDGFAMAGQRFLVLMQLLEHSAEVVVRAGVPRVELQGCLEAGFRFGKSSQTHECLSEIGVSAYVLRLEAQRRCERLGCSGRIADGDLLRPEQPSEAGIVRGQRQQRLQASDGLCRASGGTVDLREQPGGRDRVKAGA